MRKKDILNDKNIKTISTDNIDKNFDDINIIGEIEESPIKKVFSSIALILFVAVICAGILFCVYVSTNMKAVNAPIEGSVFNVGSFSFVEQEYNPSVYIKSGSEILYDGDSSGFFNDSSKFTPAEVDYVADNKVHLKGDYLRSKTINMAQVDFVLKE